MNELIAGLKRGRGCGPHSPADCNIHTRQPDPRQKRFREKGGRGGGALRIGDLLIASKVPKASDSAQSQGRPRNRFTAAHFGSTFWVTKGGNIFRLRCQSSLALGGMTYEPTPTTQEEPQTTAYPSRSTLKKTHSAVCRAMSYPSTERRRYNAVCPSTQSRNSDRMFGPSLS